MKVQINSLEALNRLIGGDTAIEFELRQSIANEFAKAHLKGLVNDAIIKTATNTFAELCITQGFEALGNSWNRTFRVNTHQHNLIKEAVQKAIDDVVTKSIHDCVNNTFAELNVKERIETLINKQTEYIVNQWSDGVIESRINSAVDARIKQKLGIK